MPWRLAGVACRIRAGAIRKWIRNSCAHAVVRFLRELFRLIGMWVIKKTIIRAPFFYSLFVISDMRCRCSVGCAPVFLFMGMIMIY